MISRDTIQKVLERTDIVEVIGEFVNLQRSGANYKALCPFHKERTPSFVVSPAKQIFKCFGCGESGNAVSFLMKHEHLSFTEAIKYLAKKYNIPIEEEEETDEQKQKLKERESILVVNKFAQKYYTDNLFNNDEGISVGLSYFRSRGFTDQTIEKFQLGYALDSRDAFTQYAQKNGFKLEVLVKSGLTIQKEDKAYDRFWARVIFPIHSMSGQVLGFAGRTLRDDKSVAKYLNSPETEIFQKRKILYGIYFAKQAITREDKCYLVEGYTDVMAFHQAGIENTVASLGTSLTEDHVNLIHRLTPNLTLIFDGDDAGIKAALRGIDIALKEDLNLRVVALPPGEDPDSFSKKLSPVDLKEYIQAHEVDFITFKTRFLLKDAADDPIKRAQVSKQVVESISNIPDPIKRSVFVQKAAELLQIDEKSLYAELQKIVAKKIKRLTSVTVQPPDLPARKTPAIPSYTDAVALPEEKELIYYLLKYGNKEFSREQTPDGNFVITTVAEYIITELQNEDLEFKNIVYKKVFQEVKSLLMNSKPIDFNYFVNHPDPDIQQVTIDILSREYPISKIWERRGALVHHPDDHYREGLQQTILSFKMKIVQLALNKLIDQMRQIPPDNFEQLTPLLEQHKRLMEIRSKLNSMLGNRVTIPPKLMQ